MKKIFIAAMMVVFVGSSAFAADTKKDAANVGYRVKSNFEANFSGATNLVWAQRDSYTKASFTLADQSVEAFFSSEGELVATSRKTDLKKLPLQAIQTIQKKYSSYNVTEAIELDQDGEKSYYVALQDGAKKQILRVSLYGSVSVYNGKK